MNNQECYQTYLADCDKYTQKKALNEFVKLMGALKNKDLISKKSEEI